MYSHDPILFLVFMHLIYGDLCTAFLFFFFLNISIFSYSVIHYLPLKSHSTLIGGYSIHDFSYRDVGNLWDHLGGFLHINVDIDGKIN